MIREMNARTHSKTRSAWERLNDTGRTQLPGSPLYGSSVAARPLAARPLRTWFSSMPTILSFRPNSWYSVDLLLFFSQKGAPASLPCISSLTPICAVCVCMCVFVAWIALSLWRVTPGRDVHKSSLIHTYLYISLYTFLLLLTFFHIYLFFCCIVVVVVWPNWSLFVFLRWERESRISWYNAGVLFMLHTHTSSIQIQFVFFFKKKTMLSRQVVKKK